MILLDQPDTAYHAHPAIGSTTAKLAWKSLRHFKDRLTGVDAVGDKPAFAVGRIAHMAVLEPERFASSVQSEGPINEKTGKPYGRDTKAFQEWQVANPGVIVVDPWLPVSLHRMPQSLMDELADMTAEMSVYQEIMRVPVKCRPDAYKPGYILDLKTIDNIDNAEKNLHQFRYWFSFGWYRMVCRAEFGEAPDMAFWFMEKAAPYRWRKVTMDGDYAAWADDQVDQTMGRIAEANESGKWDDPDMDPLIASLPRFLDPDTYTVSEDGGISL